jgi:hypothetical protein
MSQENVEIVRRSWVMAGETGEPTWNLADTFAGIVTAVRKGRGGATPQTRIPMRF